MSDFNFTVVSQMVETTAARYARKCWWADVDDLKQVGHLEALKALRTYNPAKAPRGPKPYFARAIAMGMLCALEDETAPVSGGKHRMLRTQFTRAPLEDPETETRTRLDVDPAAVIDHGRWLARVRARLRALARDDAELAALLDDRPVDALSGALAGDRDAAKRRIARFRQTVREDPKLYQLSKQRDS